MLPRQLLKAGSCRGKLVESGPAEQAEGVRTSNFYEALIVEQEEESVEAVLTVEAPLVKTKTAKRSRKKRVPFQRDSMPVAAQPVVTTPVVQTDTEAVKARSLQRPIGSSYFLPGKAEGKAVLFLIDTGCNTNLLSKHLFDKLPDKIKKTLEPCSSHGEMADGSEFAILWHDQDQG